jgi:hypothetical protein
LAHPVDDAVVVNPGHPLNAAKAYPIERHLDTQCLDFGTMPEIGRIPISAMAVAAEIALSALPMSIFHDFAALTVRAGHHVSFHCIILYYATPYLQSN